MLRSLEPRDVDAATFAQTLASMGMDETALRISDGTILPSTTGRIVETAVAKLPVLSEEDRELRLEETIGQGGMGLVRLAEQVPLHRKVAVKTLRSDRESSDSTIRLMREAWVTGGLEHPNIVPVHALGRSKEGAPLLVMKRIEGRPWSEALRTAKLDLVRHLEILIQVCRAIELAHHRGILHRDLKPENVMIGNFGEVYLLDWGIALSMSDPSGRLPVVSESVGMAGTPAYMAPEMVDDRCDRLSPRTDVYLLGAILHEIICGSPPHAAKSVTDMLFHAFKGEVPPHPSTAPRELSELCQRALDPKPEKRFESTTAFREALEGFLRHRSSEALATEARARLVELVAVLESGPENASRLMSIFGECVFGFRQALREWPENQSARAGLVQAVERMAHRAIARHELGSLEHALAQLPEPNPALEAAHAALVKEEQAEKERVVRLERLERELDLSLASGARTLGALAIGLLWIVVPIFFAFMERAGHPTDAKVVLMDAGVGWAMVAVLTWVSRRKIPRNLINLRIMGSVIITMAGMTLTRAWAFLNGLSAPQSFQLDFISLIVAAGFIALAIDVRLRLVTGVYFGAFLVSLMVDPKHVVWCLSLGNVFAMGLIAYIWGVRKDFGCKIMGAHIMGHANPNALR
ncbi:MAG: serine/threonine protein kinase [Deltaproteobacteria bacterium]|nr:serine/threonine protein kinase [Deltaproteobacteria bacterium]